jgi:hypothetical protein
VVRLHRALYNREIKEELKEKRRRWEGWECSLVVEHLPSM